MTQVGRLLYEVAARADGRRDTAAIAAEVGSELGRRITARDVAFLVDERLVPAGLVASEDAAAAAPAPYTGGPFALRVRAAVVPAAAVHVLAAALRWLFAPVVVGAVLAWLVAFDAWLLLRHSLDDALRELLAFPSVILLVYALAVAGTVFHEFGHAAACRYGGGRPGRMGVGLYYVWPVFYTDVTDAYRLDRRGRVRTDLGGVYFNAVFVLILAAAYFRTQFEPLLVVILIQHVQAAQQLVPWLRLDGYYVLTDVVGVPDVLSRVRSILRGLVPGRELDPRAAELRPWVRSVVSAYLLLTVPAFVVAYAFLLWHAPGFFVRAWGALHTQLALAEAGWRADDHAAAALGAVNALVLIVPAVGIALILAATAARALRPLLRRLGRVRGARTSAAFAAGVSAASLFFAGLAGGGMVDRLGGDDVVPSPVAQPAPAPVAATNDVRPVTRRAAPRKRVLRGSPAARPRIERVAAVHTLARRGRDAVAVLAVPPPATTSDELPLPEETEAEELVPPPATSTEASTTTTTTTTTTATTPAEATTITTTTEEVLP